MEVVPYTFLPS